MRPWQILALISGTIVTSVMALASISYSATLASPAPALAWLPVPNSWLFAVLALAFDLGMIASVFAAFRWWSSDRIAAIAAIGLFVIASLYSIHAVRGYIALNLTASEAPAARSADVYASLKLELAQAQMFLGDLQASYAEASRSERARLAPQIDGARKAVQDARTRLAHADTVAHVSPLAGLEWLLAISLWIFHATCWSAWFGTGAQMQASTSPPRPTGHDTVAAWLMEEGPSGPAHCAELFASYVDWSDATGRTPLAKYSFYARLVELGARKYRDGRNGPTMYELPVTAPLRQLPHPQHGRLSP
jgi:hypothetical protein